MSDIFFYKKANDLTSMISTTIKPILLSYVVPFFILFILFGICIFLSKKFEKKISTGKSRIILASLSILLLVILFIPIEQTKNLYLNLFFNINDYKDYNSYTSNYSYYLNYTFLSGMYGVTLQNRFSEPENYNEKELDNILLAENESEINSETDLWGKPNIILMFSESFWDIDKLEEIKFNKEVAPNFKKLEQEGKKVELLTCAYGGMSENVAFELLTGGSMNYFTKGYIPIISLYQRKNSLNIPSIIKELKENNYYSKIIIGRDYYDAEESFYKIGFDKYIEVEEEKGIDYNDISDEYITDLIINDLENKSSNDPIFYMVETIQNHMPYVLDKYENYDISIEKSSLSEDINNTILSYAQGVYDADKQLNRIYEYIKSYDEPTILIFLGDHLPFLYTENGQDVIENLEYFNTNDQSENLYRKYNTQALVLSNYDIDLNKIPTYLSTDLLLTNIVNKLDIKINNFYKWLNGTIKKLPSYNNFFVIDENGKRTELENMSSEVREIYDLREKMQYKLFIQP